MFGNDTANGYISNGITEFFYDTADQAVFGMVPKYGKLSFTPVGTADVIRVHAGDEVVFALLDTEIQGFTEAAIFQKTADVQARSELQLHVGDDSIQFRR